MCVQLKDLHAHSLAERLSNFKIDERDKHTSFKIVQILK